MTQKIKLQTRDGVREYKLLPDAAALKAAAVAGEISVGEEIVYREYIVLVLEDFELLMLERIQQMMPPQFVPPNGQWSFTVNGVPVDADQFMKGQCV